MFAIKRADRRRHIYVIGKLVRGQSTLLANMAINDLKTTKVSCVIDPHGDLGETLLTTFLLDAWTTSFILIPLTLAKPSKSTYLKVKLGAPRATSGIVSVFTNSTATPGSSTWVHSPQRLLTLLTAAQSPDFPTLTRLTDKNSATKSLRILRIPCWRTFGRTEFDNLQDRLRNEAIALFWIKLGRFVLHRWFGNGRCPHKFF